MTYHNENVALWQQSTEVRYLNGQLYVVLWSGNGTEVLATCCHGWGLPFAFLHSASALPVRLPRRHPHHPRRGRRIDGQPHRLVADAEALLRFGIVRRAVDAVAAKADFDLKARLFTEAAGALFRGSAEEVALVREVIDVAQRINALRKPEEAKELRAAELVISRARAADEGGLWPNHDKCGTCGSWGSREGDAKAGYRCCGCQEPWEPALETREEIESALRTLSRRKGTAR